MHIYLKTVIIHLIKKKKYIEINLLLSFINKNPLNHGPTPKEIQQISGRPLPYCKY